MPARFPNGWSPSPTADYVCCAPGCHASPVRFLDLADSGAAFCSVACVAAGAR